jgi:RecA-family ATPase
MDFGGDFAAAAKSLMGRASRAVSNDMGCFTPRSTYEAVQAEPHVLPEQTGSRERRFTPVSYSELVTRPPKPMLVDGLIGDGDNFMIFGAPKSGKTFVVIDFIGACISGGVFADTFAVPKPLTVAYMTNEGLGKLPDRLGACVQHNRINVSDLDKHLVVFEDVPQLFSPSGPDSILKFVEDWEANETRKLDILLIDTLNKATLGAQENDNSDAAIVCSNLMYARKRLKCATGIIHHAGRDGLKSRGASAYDGDMDLQLKVSRDEQTNMRVLSMEFAKDISDFEDICFKLVSVNESASVEWMGSAGFSNHDSKKRTMDEILLAMNDGRNNGKLWWTPSQLRDVIPGRTAESIRSALVRESKASNSMVEVSMPDEQGVTLWRLR